MVVPRHFDQELVPEILSSRRAWIDRQLERFDAQPGKFDVDWPPKCIELRGVGERVEVEYGAHARPSVKLRQDGRDLQLTLPSRVSNEHIVTVLTRWLKEMARRKLVPMAESLSLAYGFEYARVVIRGQKTRWGSYSSRGTLSLNYKLLFLPEPLATHVILHELVHSVHMDHSDKFWEALEVVDPAARLHDQQLQEAWKYLPAWLD